MRKSFYLFGVVYSILLVLLIFTALPAQEMNGFQIMKKALNKSSWKDMSGQVKLILTNARGEQRIRQIDMFSRKRNTDESDMLMRFKAPADVKGTAFLIIEKKDKDDERYLYLPAMRRVKRIASSGKGGNFMSSDFTYYDIGKPKLKDWTYKRLTDEKVGQWDCYKLECLPADETILKDTGYGKIIRWIRKDILMTVKSEYYDRGLRKWKTLKVPGMEKIEGVWFQTDMKMKDVQNNHASEMQFSNLKVNQNIPAKFFSQRFLQRGR